MAALLISTLLYVGVMVAMAVVAGALGFAMKDATVDGVDYCPLSMRPDDSEPGDQAVCRFTLFAAIGGAVYGFLFSTVAVIKLCKGISKSSFFGFIEFLISIVALLMFLAGGLLVSIEFHNVCNHTPGDCKDTLNSVTSSLYDRLFMCQAGTWAAAGMTLFLTLTLFVDRRGDQGRGPESEPLVA